jgi:hypothetical protein
MPKLINELEDYFHYCIPEKRLFLGILIRIVQDAEMIKKHLKNPKHNANHRDYYDLCTSKIDDRRRELIRHLNSDWVVTICSLVDVNYKKFSELGLKIITVPNGDYIIHKKQIKPQRKAKKI